MATKTQTISVSVRVLALVADGLDPVNALRRVLGSERVDAMIDQLYTELRSAGSGA